MTTPLYETATNFAESTLNGGINDTATQLTVTDGSIFPATGNFRLLIDDEILLGTARSTNVIDIERGQEGTVAASHSNAAPVYLVVTRDALTQYGKDGWSLFNYGPALGIWNDAGTARLTQSDFTKYNSDDETWTDQAGTILLRVPPVTDRQERIAARSTPSTPWAYIMAFQCCMPLYSAQNDIQQLGFCFRDTVTGKALYQVLANVGLFGETQNVSYGVHVSQLDDPQSTSFTTVRTNWQCQFMGPLFWMKAEDNGTDIICYVSADGSNWIEIYREGRTSYLTNGAGEICWIGANMDAHANSRDALIRLVHWSKE